MSTPSRKFWWLIWIILLLLVLGGAMIGYYLWNKPHERVEQAQAIEIAPEALAKAFAEDEDLANQTYLGQAIRLRSILLDIIEDEQGKTVVILDIPGYDLAISATLRDPPPSLALGAEMQVTGFCSGATMFDIVLSDCVINEYEPPVSD